jgi:hypothetical protein
MRRAWPVCHELFGKKLKNCRKREENEEEMRQGGGIFSEKSEQKNG